MQNLDRLMLATNIVIRSFAQAQPTAEELEAVRAQLIFVAWQMSSLIGQVQTADMRAFPDASDPSRVGASAAQEQERQLLILIQQGLEVLRQVLVDPAADWSTLVQANALLGQFQEMLEQILVEVDTTASMGQPGSEGIPPAPTMYPSPTATSAQSGAAGNEWQAMMSEMDQMLDQMQSILEATLGP